MRRVRGAWLGVAAGAAAVLTGVVCGVTGDRHLHLAAALLVGGLLLIGAGLTALRRARAD